MEKKKILFLSANAGGGHNAAVDALQQAIEKYYPNHFEMKKMDVLQLGLPYIEKFASNFYDFQSKYAKFSYKAFFEFTDLFSTQNLIDRGGYQLLKRQFKPIAEEKPDAIFVCYPLFAYSVARYMRSKHRRVPMVTVITDTGDIHSSWISKGTDYYITPTKETALFLEEEGVRESQIKLFGFTVRQWFYQKYDVEKIRSEMKINPKRKIVVYFAGLLGLGSVKTKVIELDESLRDLTILVICGKNENLKQKIEANKFHNDVRVFGFVENSDVAKYMAIADLIITKAGGISVMEAVTSKKPIIITEIIPGQEEPNAEFIETMGFGYVAKTVKKLVEKANLILDGDGERILTNLHRYHLNDHSDRQVADFVHELTNE